MQPPVHIGVLMPIGMIHPLEHLHRLLRRSTRVEIDQSLAVDFLLENGKIGACCREIESHQASFLSQRSTIPESASEIYSSSTAEVISSRKARMSMVSASAREMPRLIR